MMFSRSFSPSKLPRPPPPPPPPPLTERRHKRRQRRHNTSTTTGSSKVSLTSTIQNEKPLENPLLVLNNYETDNIDVELSTDRIEQHQQYNNNSNDDGPTWNIQHNNIKTVLEESTTTDAIEEYHLGTVHVKHSTNGCGSSITPVLSSSSSMEIESGSGGSSNGGGGAAESSDSSISGSWRNRLRLFHLFQRKHHYYNNHNNNNNITKSCETSITASRSPSSSNSNNNNNNNNSIYMNGQTDTNIHKNKNGIVRQQTTRSSNHHQKFKNYSKTVPIQKTQQQQPESLYYNNQEYTNSQYLKYQQQQCNNDNPTVMIDYNDDNVNDPVSDFDESEWTPMDSSYGAAIPLAGWIPKGIRRTIEFTVLLCIALIIVFFIVETSVRSDMKNHKSNNNNNNLYDVVTNNFNDDTAWNYTSYNDNMTSVYSDDVQIDDNNAGR